MLVSDDYFVLYDPIAKRFWSDGAIGRVYAKDAKAYRSMEAAERCRDGFWKNKRFSLVIPVTTSCEVPDA